MLLTPFLRSTGWCLVAFVSFALLLFLAEPALSSGSPDLLRDIGSNQQMVFDDPVNISNSMNVYDTMPSLTVDSRGDVHVVYMGTYAKSGAPDNITTDVFYTHAVNGVFTTPGMISVPTGYYSKNPTIAVDSEGVAHVVFMRSEDQIFSEPEDDIYYANNHTGEFDTVIQLIDGYFGFSDEKPFSSPDNPIILVDDSDNLHLSFRAADERLTTSFSQIFYTNNIDGIFHAPALVSDGIEYVSNYVMDLDANDLPHFAYESDSSVYYVKALTIQPAAAEFSAPVQAALIPRVVQDFFPGLAIDSNGTAHITFRDPYKPAFSDYELLYTNNAGGVFSAPQNVSLTGFTSSIELDAQDKVHVLYKRLGGQLAYANNLNGDFESDDLPGNMSHTGVNYFKIGPDQRYHVVYYFWRTVNENTEYDIYYVQGNWETVEDNKQIFLPMLFH